MDVRPSTELRSHRLSPNSRGHCAVRGSGSRSLRLRWMILLATLAGGCGPQANDTPQSSILPAPGNAAQEPEKEDGEDDPVAELWLTVSLEGKPDPAPEVCVDVWPEVDYAVQRKSDSGLPTSIVFYAKRPDYLVRVRCQGYVPVTGQVSFEAVQRPTFVTRETSGGLVTSTRFPPIAKNEKSQSQETVDGPWKPRWPIHDASFRVRLRKLATHEHICLTPARRPAADADVCVRGYGRYYERVVKGRGQSVFCTDERGRVLFPAYIAEAGMTSRAPAGIILLHETGYRILTRAEYQATNRTVLQPWGHVAGRVVRDGKPKPGVTISVTANPHPDATLGDVFRYDDWRVTTDSEGRFVFDRLLPGNYDCGIVTVPTANNHRPALLRGLTLGVVSGTTTEGDIGGSGRTIIGRLRVGEEWENRIDWTTSHITLRATDSDSRGREHPLVTRASPYFPDETTRVRDVPETPYVERLPPFTLRDTLSEGGAFHITDVPPDEYTVFVELQWISAPKGQGDELALNLPNHRVTIEDRPAEGRREVMLDDLDVRNSIRTAIEAAKKHARPGRNGK